jgi:hypothetical protein
VSWSRCATRRSSPTGIRILINGRAPGADPRVLVQDLAGGSPKALTPEGFELVPPVSPDGRHAIVRTGDEKPMFSIDGAEVSPLPAGEHRDQAVGWSADSRWVYVSTPSLEIPARIHRIEIASGRRELWKQMTPADPAAFGGFTGLSFTPDGKSYAYSFHRFLYDLYVLEGLN